MTAALRIDPGDASPPYEQILRQVVEHLRAGRLAEGDRLPPVRQLAGDLGLAAGTVARAYRELETRGIVRTRRGGGTTIAPGAVHLVRSVVGAQGAPTPAVLVPGDVPPRVHAAVAAARARGWGEDAVAEAVEAALREAPPVM